MCAGRGARCREPWRLAALNPTNSGLGPLKALGARTACSTPPLPRSSHCAVRGRPGTLTFAASIPRIACRTCHGQLTQSTDRVDSPWRRCGGGLRRGGSGDSVTIAATPAPRPAAPPVQPPVDVSTVHSAVAVKWSDLVTDAMLADVASQPPGMSPMEHSRCLAMAFVAGHDALNTVVRLYQPVATNLTPNPYGDIVPSYAWRPRPRRVHGA